MVRYYWIVALVIAGLVCIAIAAILARRSGVSNERIAVTAIIALAAMVAGGSMGILFGGAIAPPVQSEPWLKTYQTMVTGLFAVVATLFAAGLAWKATQNQIVTQQAIFQQQREADRKQRRLDYLRGYVPVLEGALYWLDSIRSPLIQMQAQVGMLPRDTDEFLGAIPQTIALLKTTPTMPFYPGIPAVTKRDDLVRDLEELRTVIDQFKSQPAANANGVIADRLLASRMNMLKQKIRVEADWNNDQNILRRVKTARQVELLQLEQEVEFKTKQPSLDYDGWVP